MEAHRSNRSILRMDRSHPVSPDPTASKRPDCVFCVQEQQQQALLAQSGPGSAQVNRVGGGNMSYAPRYSPDYYFEREMFERMQQQRELFERVNRYRQQQRQQQAERLYGTNRFDFQSQQFLQPVGSARSAGGFGSGWEPAVGESDVYSTQEPMGFMQQQPVASTTQQGSGMPVSMISAPRHPRVPLERRCRSKSS